MEIKTLKELQNNFNKVLDIVPNKLILVNNEIREVESYINTVPNLKNTFRSPFEYRPSPPKPTNIFKLDIDHLNRNLFSNAFNGFHLYGDFKKDRAKYDTDESYNNNQQVISQAFELSKYYQWLLNLKNKSTPNSKQKKSTLTHSQKLLALYYLGIDMSKFQNNVQSAKILSSILDLDESNTKDYLTYFEGKKSKVKNKKNIDKMIDLFEHQDFKSVLDKIKKES